MKKYIILFSLFYLVLVGCENNFKVESKATEREVVKNIQNFKIINQGNKADYSLFHFIDPFDKEGYIEQINNKGEKVEKKLIRDKHFAPSDSFYFNNNYYFTSGAYSNSSKVMKYENEEQKISLIETNQQDFVEKYYEDKESKYITTVTDGNGNNKVCDIEKSRCINFDKGYSAHTVITIDSYIIIVATSTNPQVEEQSYTKIFKYDKSMNLHKETQTDYIPDYFTYNNKENLYLFMNNWI
jgi:hypothetical protein